eukprot:8639556-Pyramimonas_sp.AAC.1
MPGSPVSGLRSPVSGLRSPVSGLWCRVSGLGSLRHGSRSRLLSADLLLGRGRWLAGCEQVHPSDADLPQGSFPSLKKPGTSMLNAREPLDTLLWPRHREVRFTHAPVNPPPHRSIYPRTG